MALDPTTRNITRLEGRRFINKCEGQIALIHRADSLREVCRLASIAVPYVLSEDYSSRDAQRAVGVAAEERARELVNHMIESFMRAEPLARDKFKRQLMDGCNSLSGPLGHLRGWAQTKLTNAEMSLR